ncbi:feruloyl esterase [Stenotrophomonas rhizophila]|uniref:Feruloyl esterase n=1 Tax=Stenotrophomonas rhizophila TaxID=216778 RepID=A0A498CIE7_9GAMM|nr:tannase/feruloyl esterase family alpha/beta hydrolase [Stenotrophomonas rhizophila]RLK57607.1 feruloyl esterase [Stenotrophomonas rhizophila]
MPNKRVSLYLAGLTLAAGAVGPVQAATPSGQDGEAGRCAALKNINLGPDISVTSATLVQAPFKITEPDYGSGEVKPPPPTTKPFCRVEVLAKPDQSEIYYEAWLPVRANWNGRFYGVGAGGFGGAISLSGLSKAMDQGYAAMATDYGHRSAPASLMWAAGQPQKVADFGYRAVHVSTTGAKRIAASFYGKQPDYSYWNGCSRGGSMGMVNAQRWYEDYDGIVSGNAARDWVRGLTSGSAYILRQVRDPAARIPPAKIPFIHAAVLQQCDARDGLKDGLISQADQCKVDTKKLLCTGGDRDDCLTKGQASALDEIYTGVRKKNGDRLADPFMPGAEQELMFLGATSFAPGGSWGTSANAEFWSGFVYEDPAYDPGKSLELEEGYDYAMKKLSWALSHQNPDLSSLKRAGGKLIMYMGEADPLLSPVAATEYYQDVVRTMGQTSADEFVRYYVAPGVGHCSGGDGPDVFNMLKPVQDWVEKGIAPAEVIASKLNKQGQVVRTRPLCPFPQIARYDGKGSIDDAASFSCGSPD